MTKSFDEWLDTTKLRGYTDENSLEAAWEAGQQSKQAEVDELQLKLSEDSRVLHNVIDIERKKCEELQKRIDRVAHILTYTNHASTPLCNELREILKGNTNDH